MFIRSERLFLRPGWMEDRAELVALIDAAVASAQDMSTSGAGRALVRTIWAGHKQALTDQAAADHASHDSHFPHFVVTLPSAAGAPMIGAAGLVARGQAAELSCWIAPQYRGKGLGTEAAGAALAIARTLGHRRVIAGEGFDCPAGLRVLTKLGIGLGIGPMVPPPTDGAAPNPVMRAA